MKFNQKGFGHLAILLVIIVIAAVAGGGWWVYDRNHKSKVNSFSDCEKANNTTGIMDAAYHPTCTYQGKTYSNPTPSTPTPSTPKPTETTTYLTVKEWKVKVPIDSSTKGLSYQLSNQNKTALFFAEVTNSTGQICVTDAAVVRGMANDVVPGGTGSTFKQSYQKGNYYYGTDGYYYERPAEGNGLDVGCGKTEDAAIKNLAILDQNSNPKLWQAASDKTGAIEKALSKMVVE